MEDFPTYSIIPFLTSLKNENYITDSFYTSHSPLEIWSFDSRKNNILGDSSNLFLNKCYECISIFDLFSSIAILPETLYDMIIFAKEDKINKKLFFHFMLELISSVIIIPYPTGIEIITDFCNYLIKSDKSKFVKTTKNHFEILTAEGLKTLKLKENYRINLLDYKHYLLCAKIIVKRPSFARIVSGENTILTQIEFSFIPYTKPNCQLSCLIGAHNICQVSFVFPSLTLEDLIEPRQINESINKTSNTHIKDTIKMSLLRESFDTLQNCINERHLAREYTKKKFQLFYDPLQICEDTYSLLSCNIGGVLELRHMYTCVNREEICNSVFSNPNDVIHSDKPMLVPLRLSLYNTSSVKTLPIDYIIKPDIKSENGIQNYTDGCGEISKDLAIKIFKKYLLNWVGKNETDKHKQFSPSTNNFVMKHIQQNPITWVSSNIPPKECFHKDYIPSAFQIRYKGFKGMLVVSNKELESPVVFRESMNKFGTKHDEILDTLFIAGVSYHVKQVILSAELIHLLEAACSNKIIQIEELLSKYLFEQREDCSDSLTGLLDYNSNSCKEFFNSNIYLTQQDKYIYEKTKSIHLTSALFSYIIQLRVPLPNSAIAYGVADFLNILKPDEIFLQITTKDGNSKVITGDIYISKSPALFVTDICYFKAVDKKELHYLKDVLVFAIDGDVAPPNKTSDADLDGDQFNIFWDKELVDLLKECNSDNTEKTRIIQKDFKKDKCDVTTTRDIKDPWKDHYNVVSYEIFKPFKNTEYCTMHHLLLLRRVFIDYFDKTWHTNPICNDLSGWIKKTLNAPKHGTWVEWEKVRESLRAFKFPEFPHYFPKTFTTRLRISVSLYSKLYDKVLSIICNNTTQSIKNQLTITDHYLRWQLKIHEICTNNIKCDTVNYTNQLQKLAQEQKDIIQRHLNKDILSNDPITSRNTLFKAIIFFHMFPNAIIHEPWIISIQELKNLNTPSSSIESNNANYNGNIIENSIISKSFGWIIKELCSNNPHHKSVYLAVAGLLIKQTSDIDIEVTSKQPLVNYFKQKYNTLEKSGISMLLYDKEIQQLLEMSRIFSFNLPYDKNKYICNFYNLYYKRILELQITLKYKILIDINEEIENISFDNIFNNYLLNNEEEYYYNVLALYNSLGDNIISYKLKDKDNSFIFCCKEINNSDTFHSFIIFFSSLFNNVDISLCNIKSKEDNIIKSYIIDIKNIPNNIKQSCDKIIDGLNINLNDLLKQLH